MCARGPTVGCRVVRRFLKKPVREGTIVCVSVVPADGVVKPRKLSPADHQRAVRRWKDKLCKAGVTWFVGAIDISFNEHKSARYRPFWSIHSLGLTVTDDRKKLKRELRRHFPSTDYSIPVPVKVTKWDGDPKALGYILKPNFWRRIGTDDAQAMTWRQEVRVLAVPPTNSVSRRGANANCLFTLTTSGCRGNS